MQDFDTARYIISIEVGIRHVEQSISRSGREHKMGVVYRTSGSEYAGGAICAVDRNAPISDKLDVLFCVEFGRS
jgi:hypothetical protein